MDKKEKGFSEDYSKLKGARGRNLRHRTRNLEPGRLIGRRKDKCKRIGINTSSKWMVCRERMYELEYSYKGSEAVWR